MSVCVDRCGYVCFFFLYLSLSWCRDGGAGAVDPPFYLCAGFPPKDVTDLGLSLEAAGLVGASIVQKSA
jgi:hypothetical protein